MRPCRFSQRPLELRPGSVILVFTIAVDNAVEAASVDEGLQQSFANVQNATAALGASVVAAVEAAIGEGEVVYGPVNATHCLRTATRARMAFVDKSGGLVENLQRTKLDTWRGEPTPWTQAGP